MKLAKMLVIGALFASMGLFAGKVMADVVNVSTAAVTTVSSGDTGRKHFVMQNTDSALKVYFAKTSSSATITAGNILNTYGSTGDTITLLDYSGPVYAVAASSNAQATVSLRTFKVAR
jgi:hypothetical protein